MLAFPWLLFGYLSRTKILASFARWMLWCHQLFECASPEQAGKLSSSSESDNRICMLRDSIADFSSSSLGCPALAPELNCLIHLLVCFLLFQLHAEDSWSPENGGNLCPSHFSSSSSARKSSFQSIRVPGSQPVHNWPEITDSSSRILPDNRGLEVCGHGFGQTFSMDFLHHLHHRNLHHSPAGSFSLRQKYSIKCLTAEQVILRKKLSDTCKMAIQQNK